MASDGPKRRRALPLTLITIGSVLAFLAIFAIWANRQLLDTDNWTDTSTQLLEDDEIRGQLSIYLIEQLYANVDVQAELADTLPPRLQPLAGPAAGAFQDLGVRGVDRLLERPRAQELWEQANRRAHRRFLQVVEDGGSDNVSTTGGDVTLDLKGILEQTQAQFGVGGRLAERLPADAAQLTILHSDELELAQDGVNFLKALAIILVILALGLMALGVYLARGWRREALRACGFGLILAGVAALVARSLGGSAVVGLAKTASVEPALENTWSISTSLLVEAASAAILYGIVVFFAAWLAGPTAWATSTRRALAPFLREPRFAYGGLALIVLLLVAWGPTPAFRKPVLALILIALMALGVEALRRHTAREFPNANREDMMRGWRERRAARRPGGAAGPTNPGNDRFTDLERLAALHDSGVLDDDEFKAQKARFLL